MRRAAQMWTVENSFCTVSGSKASNTLTSHTHTKKLLSIQYTALLWLCVRARASVLCAIYRIYRTFVRYKLSVYSHFLSFAHNLLCVFFVFHVFHRAIWLKAFIRARPVFGPNNCIPFKSIKMCNKRIELDVLVRIVYTLCYFVCDVFATLYRRLMYHLISNSIQVECI